MYKVGIVLIENEVAHSKFADTLKTISDSALRHVSAAHVEAR
jgi:hypothetical protein